MRNCRQALPPRSPRGETVVTFCSTYLQNATLTSTSGLQIFGCEAVVKSCHGDLQNVKLPPISDLQRAGRPADSLAATRKARTRREKHTHAHCGWRQRVRGGFLYTIPSESWPKSGWRLRVAPASRGHFPWEKQKCVPFGCTILRVVTDSLEDSLASPWPLSPVENRTR